MLQLSLLAWCGITPLRDSVCVYLVLIAARNAHLLSFSLYSQASLFRPGARSCSILHRSAFAPSSASLVPFHLSLSLSLFLCGLSTQVCIPFAMSACIVPADYDYYYSIRFPSFFLVSFCDSGLLTLPLSLTLSRSFLLLQTRNIQLVSLFLSVCTVHYRQCRHGSAFASTTSEPECQGLLRLTISLSPRRFPPHSPGGWTTFFVLWQSWSPREEKSRDGRTFFIWFKNNRNLLSIRQKNRIQDLQNDEN